VTSGARTTLVLGGARSGKSALAEQLARDSGLERHYVATGQAWDEEMRQRVLQHRQGRGEGWQTHEVPLDLPLHLQQLQGVGRVVLVDCLTLWVTNLMMADTDIDASGRALVDCVAGHKGRLILVSNEVGLGIVPDNKMAREFRDHAGRLHQQIAAVAEEVYFVAAGLPLKMKG
jgi:adenosylcobinamide kinase/adenosylcobinamide-phosphate guanylyltransferase